MWTEEARELEPGCRAPGPGLGGPRLTGSGAAAGPGRAGGHLLAVPLPPAAAGGDRAAAGRAAHRAGPACWPGQQPARPGSPPRWTRRSGSPRHLPPRGSGCPNALPPVRSPRRAVVGMLSGCVQSVFFPQVNAATARVLATEGCDVIIPRAQGCCGALSLHSGREAEAMRASPGARIATFEQAGVDAVVVNSAGCGSAMKEYERLLRSRPTAAGPSARPQMSSKVRDLAEFLAELGPGRRRGTRCRSPAAYHDACHLAHAQRITSAAARPAARDPRAGAWSSCADAGTCCGSAGVYNLLQPEAASELGAPQGRVGARPPGRRCSSRPTRAARCK